MRCSSCVVERFLLPIFIRYGLHTHTIFKRGHVKECSHFPQDCHPNGTLDSEKNGVTWKTAT